MSDIAEIEAHLNRAQSAYDKLPLSGPVTSWCEMYGEDLLDSCTKLFAALKQRIELINATGDHWLELCRVTHPPIPWEGAIDKAMEAACKEVTRLRARVAELEVQLEQSRSLGKLGGYPCTPEHTWAEWLEDRHKRVAELEAAQEWRPIETAPRGIGNEIVYVLLVTAGDPRSMKLGYWDAYYASGGRGYNGGDGWVADEAGEYRLLHDGPTHWLPLPAPPKVAT